MSIIIKTPAQLAEEQAEAARAVRAGMALAALVAAVLLLPVQAFLLMLAMGAMHGIIAAVPAVGFGTAVLLMASVDLLAFTSKKFRK